MDIDRIIERYLRGKATAEEERLLRKWAGDSKRNARTLRNMEKVWRFRPGKRVYINEEEVSDRVWTRLVDEKQKGQLWRLPWIYRAAAALILIITFGFLIRDFLGQKEATAPDPSATLTTKANPAGVKSTIELPDGSTVILNAESSIAYNFGNEDTVRLLELNGEAFFQVQKDERRPFVVRSGNTDTYAIGTKFNVQAYPESETVDVTLTSGSVLVKLKTAPLQSEYLLEPGEVLVYDKQAMSAQKLVADVQKTVAWKDGTIYFEKDDLETIIKTLSRWYGVHFTIRNYNGEPWNYSGKFTDEYLDVVLQSISYSEHFDYRIIDGEVILDFETKKPE